MATPQNRKRQRAHEPLQDGRPTKARKTESALPNAHPAKRPHRDQTVRDKSLTESVNPPTLEHHGSWHYPPEFWDRLSTIPLIHEALQELDRRTRLQPAFPSPPPPPLPPTGLAQDLAPTPTTTQDLARFARHGGPDLCDLRGYPAASNYRFVDAMSSTSQSRATKSINPTTITTKSGTGTTKSKKSKSAYNRGFEQHLTDHGIHETWNSQEPDLWAVYIALENPRPSLSPSQFSDSMFKAFRKTNAQVKDEDDVLADVIPTIAGTREANYPSARNTIFGHLDPLTDGTIAQPKPDIYYGAVPSQLNPTIRNELGPYIIPSTTVDKPIAPNFFMEAKGPDGSAAVMIRQARYDGAVGARAIHSLQNYGQEEPVYDGNAYTFSSTYHDGLLKIYAHHATSPAKPGGSPEYHMTQIDTWAMTGNFDSFRRGATAFRNTRDLAKQHRDNFIQVANSRYHTRMAAAQENDDQRDCSQEPQSSTAATEPPPSFTTSFTSSPPSSSNLRNNIDSRGASSKRHRNSQSPPSEPRYSKRYGSASRHHTTGPEQARSGIGKDGKSQPTA